MILSVKSSLIHVATGLFISLLWLLANDKLFQGNAQIGDPLLFITWIAGALTGLFAALRLFDLKEHSYGAKFILNVLVGFCLGTTLIGLYYVPESIKWLTLLFCPVVFILAGTDPEESKQLNKI